MTEKNRRTAGRRTGRGVPALRLAAAAGTVHGLFSLYWALGGNWLVATLGRRLLEQFTDARWLLVPVGLVKIGFAILPLVLAALGWPVGRFWRPVCGLGAAALILWGGLNTVVGNLVLAGVITPAGGYDHDGMVGHAWLWDPLFLFWGVALAAGLLASGVLPAHRP